MIFGNPIIILGVIAIILGIGLVYFAFWYFRHEYQLMYLSEVDFSGTILKILNVGSTIIDTIDNKRFIRVSPSFNIKRGIKVITMFLGKVGTGYCYRIESDKKDLSFFDTMREVMGKEFVDNLTEEEISKILETPWYMTQRESIGTLWDALNQVLGEELMDTLPEEHRIKLIDSKIYVTVKLEEGLTPEGFKPITEEDIKSEANKNMASLIGQGIKQTLKEDWLKIALAVGCGIGLCFIAQSIGLFEVITP